MRREEHIRAFVEVIWQWFTCHKRSLPWRDLKVRDDTERAYRILVSEVMLQQTQVFRVKVVYVRFLKQFPTLRSLAEASNREVIRAWRGMGYNSRALRLRDAARRIVEDFNGVFPREMKALHFIKG
ncbi:MAG: A/G-specific adenine glycosylase, partial [Candidatus Peregrinibacteria bacterium]